MVRGKWLEQAALQAVLDELATRFGGDAAAETAEEPSSEPAEAGAPDDR